ncbi:acyl-CoA thioesterase [Piscirickettsia salmonis]|uniref:acyl-CoA thioesterase n=1 Tax=Piscirickettsia salmonis TaxID=1238 RepID=UPI0039F62F6A
MYYKNSLRSSDEFTVSLKIEKITATRLIIYQEISKLSTHTHKVILTAMNTIVCINRHKNRPMRIPQEITDKLTHKQ